jgi:hypothetical protein
MRYVVEFTAEARCNYRELYDFIALRSQQGADAWHWALEQSLTGLETQPLAC